ncbi:MAG: hypothetical protein IT581_21470 [Verrucomicrobiales bacterium]|nr:hypothetical protein [Verrucomicrobiales bacterium]
MKTRSFRRMTSGWVGCNLMFLALGNLQAATPKFDPPGIVGGRVTLNLRGDSGQNYRIEGSSDLKSWSPLATGVAAGGVLTASDAIAVGGAGRFYRGVAVSATKPYPTVSAAVSDRFDSSGLVTPEAGGAVFLGLPDGARYSIEFATNAIFEATMVKMTVVTNVTGLPTAAGALAAVRLEPAGLILAAPTFLTIEFPTNIPATHVSSFAFDNDGANLHLVPDVVVTNRVRILVNQLRTYGCGVFTEAELTDWGSTVPAAARSKPALHATMEECYPEDEAAAKALRKELEDKIRPIQVEMAEKLGIERQKQLLGVADDNEGISVLGDLMGQGETFYQNEILPKVPSATQKCATTRELLTWMLGWERQKQLLGTATDDDTGMSEITAAMCAGFQKCQDQAIECCRTKGGDTRLITFLLGIERQRQLLGIEDSSCGKPIDTQGLIDDCAPKWYGTLKITEDGSYSTNRTTSAASDTEREKWSVVLDATVASVEEKIIPEILFIPGHTNLVFTLAGPLIGSYQHEKYYKDNFDPCAGSQRALARVKPHDGGDALEYHATIASSTNKPVTFEVRATILAPGTGAVGVSPSLSFNVPFVVAKDEGWIRNVTTEITSEGCVETDNSGLPDGSESFGGVFVSRGSGGFQYTADSIKYLRITPRQFGKMLILQRLELDFRRIK